MSKRMIAERCLNLSGTLAEQVEILWRRQTVDWPMLAEGLASFRKARTLSFRINDAHFVVQNNPARVVSASAKVDDASIAQRGCYLCPDRLPEAQRAIAYGNDWLILCNPVPLFEPHFTIASVDHKPQLVDHVSETMLDLSRDLDGAYTVFYNGPRCGASLPDHLHVQASPTGATPFESELANHLTGGNNHAGHRAIEWLSNGPVRVGTMRASWRPVVVLVGESKELLLSELERVIEAISQIRPAEPEPMLNMYATYTEDRWIVWLFPRAVHRPAIYGDGPEDLLISPGSVDLAGLIIAPRAQDVERLDPATIQSILAEVLMSPEQFASLRDRLASLKEP